MCGIAGFLNPRNNDKKTEKEIYQILKKMNEVQRHRGPDDEGIDVYKRQMENQMQLRKR